MSTLIEPFKHTRLVPDSWTEMVHTADSALSRAGGGTPFPKNAVTDCLNQAITLDPGVLDDARYYGLGQIGHFFGLELSEPQVQKDVISKVGDILVMRWRQGSLNPRGLTFNDLYALRTLIPLLGPFNEIALRASDQLPSPERLAIDSLSVVAKFRKTNGNKVTELLYTKQKNRLVNETRKGVEGAIRLADESMAGTRQVMSTVFGALQEHILKTESRTVTDDDPIAELLQPVELNDLGLLRVSIPSANLRLDELLYDLHNYITIDESGKPVFLTSKLPREAELPDPTPRLAQDGVVLLHTNREKCPAVFVRGLIPLISRMAIESIVIADARIKRQLRSTK